AWLVSAALYAARVIWIVFIFIRRKIILLRVFSVIQCVIAVLRPSLSTHRRFIQRKMLRRWFGVLVFVIKRVFIAVGALISSHGNIRSRATRARASCIAIASRCLFTVHLGATAQSRIPHFIKAGIDRGIVQFLTIRSRLIA